MINFDREDLTIICILIFLALVFSWGIYEIIGQFHESVAICNAHGMTLHQGANEYFCVDKNGQAFYFP